jgi:hypothetical protein
VPVVWSIWLSMVCSLPVANFVLIVAAEGFHRQRGTLHVLRHRGQHILWQREDDSDRLQLREDEHGRGIGGVHDVALIHLPQADAPANGAVMWQ